MSDKLKNVWKQIKAGHEYISSNYGHTAREDKGVRKLKMKLDKDVSGAEAAATKNTTYSDKKIKNLKKPWHK